MTDNNAALRPDTPDEDALRRRLINRIAIAGIAIVGLLGGLAVIDSLYVAPTASVAKKAKPSAIVDRVKPANVPSLSSVEVTPVPAEAPPEPPKPEAVPIAKRAPLIDDHLSRRKHLPTSPPARKSEDDVTGPTTSTAPTPPPRKAQSARQFVLQMGVFNNVDNAQELLVKLQKGGVPAQIEARVQVGPFTNKAEAERARAKLEAMGLNAGLLMAIHK